MKNIVLKYGLIAGAVMALAFLVALPFHERIGFDNAMVYGYASMVAAFLAIYFGMRSYRDKAGDGSLSFGRAFAIGALITCVASACYVASWEVIYFTTDIGAEYMAGYQEHIVNKERAKGTSQAEIDKKVVEMQQFAEMYKNPVVNSAITFLEPLPVGLLVALVSAAIVGKRRRRQPSEALA